MPYLVVKPIHDILHLGNLVPFSCNHIKIEESPYFPHILIVRRRVGELLFICCVCCRVRSAVLQHVQIILCFPQFFCQFLESFFVPYVVKVFVLTQPFVVAVAFA